MSGGAVHLLLVAAMAAPPVVPDPSACAADDFRCLGTAYVAAARAAKTGDARAQSLYSAHRAFLRLFDRSQDGRDLCQAHELIRQARKIPGSPLGPRLLDSERETLSRLRSSGVDCGVGRAKRSRRPIATSEPLPPTPVSAPPESAPAEAPPPELAPVPTANSSRAAKRPRPEPMSTPPSASPALAARPQVEHRGPVFSDPAFRPYKPLLIGGGVALVGSLVLGGLSVYYGTTGLATRRSCIAEPCSEGSTLLEYTEYNTELNAYEKYTGRAWLAGLAGGAAFATAVTLLTVGAWRRKQTLAFGPMLRANAGGVLFTGRF